MAKKGSKQTCLKPPFVIKIKRERDFDEGEIDSWIEMDCRVKPQKQRRRHYINYIFTDIDDAFKFKLHWVRA